MRTLQKISVVIIGLALCACSDGGSGTETSSSGSSGEVSSSSSSTSSSTSTGGSTSDMASSMNGSSSDASSSESSATSTASSSSSSSGSSTSTDPNMGTLGVFVDLPGSAVLLNGQMFVASMTGNTVQVPVGTYEVEIRPPTDADPPRLPQYQRNVTISANQMTRFKNAQENQPARFDMNICGEWQITGGGSTITITGYRIEDEACNDRGFYWVFNGFEQGNGEIKLQNFILRDEGCNGEFANGGGGVSPDGLQIYFTTNDNSASGYQEPSTYTKLLHGPCGE